MLFQDFLVGPWFASNLSRKRTLAFQQHNIFAFPFGVSGTQRHLEGKTGNSGGRGPAAEMFQGGVQGFLEVTKAVGIPRTSRNRRTKTDRLRDRQADRQAGKQTDRTDKGSKQASKATNREAINPANVKVKSKGNPSK